MISIQDFKKLDLRVGKVESVEPVPGADKLLKLTVDLGEEEKRSLVAGIALSYPPEAIVGKFIIVLANLEPATIRGIRSEGMLLAGWIKGDDRSISLLTIDRELPPGTPIS